MGDMVDEATVPSKPESGHEMTDAGKAKAVKKIKLKRPGTGETSNGPKIAELKPATASREDNLTYDAKHMAAYDIAPVPKGEADFLHYTRDSVQLLVNHMFTLPQSRIEEGMVAELPKEFLFKLPRQKPVPKVKQLTRWEKFMQDKNMTKKKRSRLVYDEATDDWVPRWGYKSVKKTKEAGEQGIYEVKPGEDPNSNPFERMKAEKKLLMARQKLREVRNKVEAAGGKMRASVPDLMRNQGGSARGKEGLREALKRAQVSTGSRGKFDRTAPNEATNLQEKRSKVNVESRDKEKERYMKFAGKVLSGETVDKDRAAKIGNRQAEGLKVGGRQVKGVKGTPGKSRRSKQGGKKGAGGGRTRGRKVKR